MFDLFHFLFIYIYSWIPWNTCFDTDLTPFYVFTRIKLYSLRLFFFLFLIVSKIDIQFSSKRKKKISRYSNEI